VDWDAGVGEANRGAGLIEAPCHCQKIANSDVARPRIDRGFKCFRKKLRQLFVEAQIALVDRDADEDGEYAFCDGIDGRSRSRIDVVPVLFEN
jgi:hypothetical protein